MLKRAHAVNDGVDFTEAKGGKSGRKLA